MKEKREHVIDIIFSLALLCVFTVSGLLLVFMGINVYKDTVLEMEQTFSERTALLYLTKQVRQNDTTGGVTVGDVEGEVALILTEDSEGEAYCKYIYYYDGYLCELHAEQSIEPTLSAGQPLIEVDGWKAVKNENDTISMYIEDKEAEDEFRVTLSLRSE